MINYYVCNMKVTKYLPILAVCLMTTGCNSKKEAVLTSGIDLANLDTTAMPGTSFYQYACGGWVAAHPLTDEYSRFGTFDMSVSYTHLTLPTNSRV